MGYGTFWCGLLLMGLKDEELRCLCGISNKEEALGCLGFGLSNTHFERPVAR